MSGVAQATIWAPELSHDQLAFYYDGATAVKACEQGAPHNPAACVAVPRGAPARGFAVAAVVDAMPRVDHCRVRAWPTCQQHVPAWR